MKRIAAFIDFTEGCKIALEQASVIAEKTGAQMYVVYIMIHPGDIKAKEEEISAFARNIPGIPANFIATAGSGELFEGSARVLRMIDPDLVVVGTHGIKGLKQQLFGAHILKLVQAIPFPCIVVQENTKVNRNGFERILFPVGSHPNFKLKIEQTNGVAGIFQSEIIEYEIDKAMADDDQLKKNSLQARDFFEAGSLPFRYVLEDMRVMSVGYSRQTLNYAKYQNCDLISLMSDVPATEVYIGKADKENFLTNEFGIPVLCCNS